MMKQASMTVGFLFFSLVCLWAAGAAGMQLARNLRTGKAIDRNAGEVEREDAKGMFVLQVLGTLFFIVLSAGIGIIMLVAAGIVLLGID